MTDHKEKALYHHARKPGAKEYILQTFPLTEIELAMRAELFVTMGLGTQGNVWGLVKIVLTTPPYGHPSRGE